MFLKSFIEVINIKCRLKRGAKLFTADIFFIAGFLVVMSACNINVEMLTTTKLWLTLCAMAALGIYEGFELTREGESKY